MPSADQLSLTLEAIYAAAADPALWEDALGSIATFAESAGAVLHVIPNTENGIIASYLGAGAREAYSPENVAEWVEHYAAHCPRLAAGVRWPDRPYIVDSMILSEAEMDKDPVYQWYGSYGLRYFVGSMLPETPSARLAWSLQRTAREGHAQASQIDAFLLLKPHIAQALALADRLGTLGRNARFGSSLLDALPYALFAIDEVGEIQHVNARAQFLAARGDGLRIEGRRLCAAGAVQQFQLDRAVAAALTDRSIATRGGWVRLQRPSGRRPYTCFVSRLELSEGLSDGRRPKALVIITDPDEAVAPDDQALQELFGLTGMEIRVASALAAGHSIKSAAAEFRISVETLRSHLKHIFSKIGVSRQQDLIRALAEVRPFSSSPSPERGISDRFNEE